MRFVIENINKVHTADIKLNGLTVIAGENDSGKSTVGKLLFSTVKALANTDTSAALRKKQPLVEKYVKTLYSRLSIENAWTQYDVSDLFPRFRLDFVRTVTKAYEEGVLENFLKVRADAVNNKFVNTTPRIKSLMLKDIENIRISITKSGDRNAAMMAEVQYFVESEFMNRICAHHTPGSCVRFEMGGNDKSNRLIFTLKDNQVDSVAVSDGEFLKDATYVESPLYLHVLDSLLFANTFREVGRRALFPMVPVHIKDLAEKIYSMRLIASPGTMSSEFQINEITGGRFEYDTSAKKLVFVRDEESYTPINVASGIKSFGVIQMLLDVGAISEDRILIWDEPENHMHPQWQVRFAGILVKLAKTGIPIVISTHSPYFIQGIRYFAAANRIEPFVNYYLAEESGSSDGLSAITDVTDDLDRVFIKLSEPLNEIMNIPYDSQ